MTKRKAVFIGFILVVIIESFFAHYDFIGLLIAGFITGYIAHDGILNGFWNGAVAGAMGAIVCAILFLLLVIFGGSLIDIFGGLTGFTVTGIESIFVIIGQLIYFAIVMGITGAVGGAIASRD
ncbi:DUF5518 domain-containing protein [Methanobrevibacter sp.]|uniref:DUF5518 domain-containing protein n=1 Tax=Methanobrevibacter sp. TaxID=66852 RepID=UPI0025F36DEF|nr:DUF5518 domain-containing protein [Methanobrevibacter sp.]MBQ2831709.1 DUF5518 domain-containing protein [Methanobrevibacter sp.]